MGQGAIRSSSAPRMQQPLRWACLCKRLDSGLHGAPCTMQWREMCAAASACTHKLSDDACATCRHLRKVLHAKLMILGMHPCKVACQLHGAAVGAPRSALPKLAARPEPDEAQRDHRRHGEHHPRKNLVRLRASSRVHAPAARQTRESEPAAKASPH
eukprot:365533-Chlamydomonas_euryale.AAC.3